MLPVPISSSMCIIPNVQNNLECRHFQDEVCSIIDGKTIAGVSKAQHYGQRVLGHVGALQRHELPSELAKIGDHIVQFLINNREQLDSTLTTGLDAGFKFNQVDVAKLSSGGEYSFIHERDQECVGPIVTVMCGGRAPLVVSSTNSGDLQPLLQPVTVHGDFEQSMELKEVKNMYVYCPTGALLVTSPQLCTNVTRAIVGKTTTDRLALVKPMQQPVKTIPLNCPSLNLLNQNIELQEPVKKEYLRGYPLLWAHDNLMFAVDESETKSLVSTEPFLQSIKRTASYWLTFRCFRTFTGEENRISSVPMKKSTTTSKSVGLDFTQLSGEQAAVFEDEHVRKVYNDIAAHFSGTRYQAWPQVDKFVMQLKRGCLMADLGCGNGKYLTINPNIISVGFDISSGLAQIAYQRDGKRYNVAEGNCLNAPYRSGIFDHAISIAVIHHMSTRERRLQLLREAARVIRIGGTALVTAWAKEQEADSRRVFEGHDVWVPFKTPQNVKEKLQNESMQKKRDSEISSPVILVQNETPITHTTTTNNNNTTQTQAQQIVDPAQHTENLPTESDHARYYHMFQQGEFEDLVSTLQAEGYPVKCQTVFYDKGNWCLIMEKTDVQK